MTYEDIIYDAQNGVARITINRPQVMNAFRGITCEESREGVRAFKEKRKPDFRQYAK